MDRRSALMRLTQELRQATQAADWTAMARIDRDIAALLSGLGAADALSAAERAALVALRAAHREAFERCEREAVALDERLADLCTHKDGRIAYALNDWQENAS